MQQSINTKIEITYRNSCEIPKYIKEDMIRYRLEFWVMRVRSCKEYFDENLIIFKFQSKDYSSIIRFTGNNIVST